MEEEKKLHIDVGISAVSSPMAAEVFERGLDNLRQLGFRPIVPLDPTRDYSSVHADRFVVASAQERAASLTALFENPDVKFIISARGGYGSIEILPYLDFAKLARCRKPFVGFSDSTVLLLSLFSQAGVPTIHGPSLMGGFANMASREEARQSVECLLDILGGHGLPQIYSGQIIRAGTAQGPVIAANLTMLQTLIGTPWDICLDGSILVLEDVNEAPYRIHRNLNHLRHAGKLDKLAGLVFGSLSGCPSGPGPQLNAIPRLAALDILPHTSYPILSGFSVGHEGRNMPIPIGCAGQIVGGNLELLHWTQPVVHETAKL